MTMNDEELSRKMIKAEQKKREAQDKVINDQ